MTCGIDRHPGEIALGGLCVMSCGDTYWQGPCLACGEWIYVFTPPREPPEQRDS